MSDWASELRGIADSTRHRRRPVAMGDGLHCHPCSRTFIDGQPRDLGPAAYWWVYDDGVRLPLCVHCCAAWRQFSAEDPETYGTAARIVQIAA